MSTIEAIGKVSAPGLSVGRRAWVPGLNIQSITNVCNGIAQTVTGAAPDAIPLPQVGELVCLPGESEFCYFLGWLNTNDGADLRALVANYHATETRELTRPAELWDARNTVTTGRAYLSADRTLDLLTSVWKDLAAKNDTNMQDKGVEARVAEAYQRGYREATEQAENALEAKLARLREWADDSGHCSEFDEAAELVGWAGRERDFTVTVRLEVELEVPYLHTGPSSSDRVEDDFCAANDEDDLLRMIRVGEIDFDSITAISRTVESVEAV